jgi:hypothetical protein
LQRTIDRTAEAPPAGVRKVTPGSTDGDLADLAQRRRRQHGEKRREDPGAGCLTCGLRARTYPPSERGLGCYLPCLWLKHDRSPWLLLPAGASLALFAWLLSLHPTAAGRVYAAYGGVYIGVAIVC